MIDNSGAMACLVKDYSSDRDSAKLVHTFWALVSALEIDVWFEFVYSEANIADWPSRGELGFVGDLGAREVRAVFPPLDQWGFADPMYVLSSTDGAPPPAKRRRRR